MSTAKAIFAFSLAITSAAVIIQPMAAGANAPLLVCGNAGSVKERMDDCRRVNLDAAERLRWKLVRVDETLQQTWMDSRTRLVWGPRLPAKHGYFEALMHCANSKDFYLNRLPSLDEYEVATYNEMQSVLPDVRDEATDAGAEPRDFYWTATANKNESEPRSAYFYWASASTPGKSTFQPMAFDQPNYVRCVGLHSGR